MTRKKNRNLPQRGEGWEGPACLPRPVFPILWELAGGQEEKEGHVGQGSHGERSNNASLGHTHTHTRIQMIQEEAEDDVSGHRAGQPCPIRVGVCV